MINRGEPPSNPIMPFEMNDYLKKFAEKVEALINDTDTLKEDELKAGSLTFCYIEDGNVL